MTTLLLIRHGRTSANTAGILAGRTPGVELDDVGHRQVVSTAERIRDVALAAVITSPLRRCRQTAQALLTGRESLTGQEPLTTTVENGLTECGYGEWTGRPLRELAKDKLWPTVQQQPSAVRFPGGESMTEMAARAVGAVRGWDARLAAEHGDHAVWAAVSHGDVIKAILADALGLHLDGFQRLMVDPASISIIRYTATRPYLLTHNSTTIDLAELLKPPPAKRRRARRTDTDAAVGGGLGAAQ